MRRVLISGFAVVAFWIGLIVCSASPVFAQTADVSAYRIQADDVLDIYVVDVPEITRKCRVGMDGTVDVPMLGQVSTTGTTPPTLADRISTELRKSGLVTDPRVNVSVVQSRLSSVSITGAVKKPQIYPLFGTSTLLDVLSQAEGLEQDAGETIVIQRENVSDGRERGELLNVDAARLLSGAREMNVPIYAGDRITVPRAGVVYVVGAVNKPGGFQLGLNRQRISLLQAIALAEDLKTTALRSKALLIRKDAVGPQGRSETQVDLRRVLEGKSPDMPLQADDILFIPDSSSRKLLKRGAEAVLQVATGVAIYGRY